MIWKLENNLTDKIKAILFMAAIIVACVASSPSFAKEEKGRHSLDVAIDKLFNKISKSNANTPNKVMIVSSNFYELNSEISMPLAVSITDHIISRIEKSGVDVSKPVLGNLNGWVFQGYWSIYENKITMNLQAVPWIDGQRGKMIMVPVSIPVEEIAEALDAHKDMDVWGRTLVRRLLAETPQERVQRVYVSSITSNDERADMKFITQLSQWIKDSLSDSITLLPINVSDELSDIDDGILLGRAAEPRMSLTADLLEADLELNGEIGLNREEIIVNTSLEMPFEEHRIEIPIAFPIEVLPEEIRPKKLEARKTTFDRLETNHSNRLQRNSGNFKHNASFSINDYLVEITSNHGNQLPTYDKEDDVRLFVRGNKPVYTYVFNVELERGKNVPTLLFPEIGTKSEKIEANELLILKSDKLKTGRSFVWVVTSEVNLDRKLLKKGKLRSNIARQLLIIRNKARKNNKGHAEARLLLIRH